MVLSKHRSGVPDSNRVKTLICECAAILWEGRAGDKSGAPLHVLWDPRLAGQGRKFVDPGHYCFEINGKGEPGDLQHNLE